MKGTKLLFLTMMIISVWTQTLFSGSVVLEGNPANPAGDVGGGPIPRTPVETVPKSPAISQNVPDSQLNANKGDPEIGERIGALNNAFTSVNAPKIGTNPSGIIFPFPIFPKFPTKDCPACDCKCKTRYLSIRTAAHPKVPWNWNYYAYLGSYSTAFGWQYPAFFYYYLGCYPDFVRGDGFIGLEHCDGTWSFQNKYGNYLSGYRVYSKYNGCAERWRIIRNGSGSYIQNLWTGGYLWYNDWAYQWQIHPWLRTSVIVEFWPEYRY